MGHLRDLFKSSLILLFWAIQANFLLTTLGLSFSLSFYIHYFFSPIILHIRAIWNFKTIPHSLFVVYYLLIFVMILTRGHSHSHNFAQCRWPHTLAQTMRLISSSAYVKSLKFIVWKYTMFCFSTEINKLKWNEEWATLRRLCRMIQSVSLMSLVCVRALVSFSFSVLRTTANTWDNSSKLSKLLFDYIEITSP